MSTEESHVPEHQKPRWANIRKLLERTGPFSHPDFEPSSDILQFMMKSCKLLVVGAGGLGCELLKNLALMGFQQIHVIDMDTIELSNLNRQFLFRRKDIGHSKAECAAAFINNRYILLLYIQIYVLESNIYRIFRRVPGCNVVPHHCAIQDKDETFYSQFNIVVCGLDSIVARRWLNGMLLSLLSFNNDGKIHIYLVIM